jgi:hypothetical protein
MKLYCDTCCLPFNMVDVPTERAAMERLIELFPIFGSHIVNREAGNTKTEARRNILTLEAKGLSPAPKQTEFRGSFTQAGIASVFISDVPDEKIRIKIMERCRLKQPDADHLAIAICNGCEVFLTRDGPIHRNREWLEAEYKLRVLRPSELLRELSPPREDFGCF